MKAVADNESETTKNDITRPEQIHEMKKKHESLSYIKRIKEIFDLDLLRDGVYLNVIVGLSLYYVAESNFKLMTPFFLSHIGKYHFRKAKSIP